MSKAIKDKRNYLVSQEEQRLIELKQRVKDIELRIQKLNQEEYNKWYKLFGDAFCYQHSEQ